MLPRWTSPTKAQFFTQDRSICCHCGGRRHRSEQFCTRFRAISVHFRIGECAARNRVQSRRDSVHHQVEVDLNTDGLVGLSSFQYRVSREGLRDEPCWDDSRKDDHTGQFYECLSHNDRWSEFVARRQRER